MGEVVIARTARGRPAEAPIFYGLRGGVGRTVLLKELQRQADRAGGWVTVEVEGKQDKGGEQLLARQRLARGLMSSIRSVSPPPGGRSRGGERSER